MKKRIKVMYVFLLFVTITNAQTNNLKIATFNIQNFGLKKIEMKEVVDTLVMIVRQFDIVAVQEVSDASNYTAGAFLKEINKSGAQYKMVCSERTGLQPDDNNSREQYAFYYNTATVTLTDKALYDDSENDYFQREPYIAQFRRKTDGFVFVLCTIHTTPDVAVEEIAALIHVAEWIPGRFSNSAYQIYCGDFNASCSYASPLQLESLAFHKKPYCWVVPDDTKTNLSKNTCAYDRFVITSNLLSRKAGWGVYRFFKSKAVSDHWPVFLELK